MKLKGCFAETRSWQQGRSKYCCLVGVSSSHPLWIITDAFHLGAGESGKSTILKQMRIIYAEGFRPEERREVRQVIFSNMIVAFKIIAEEMRELGIDYENQKSQVHFLPDL